ncbi:Protein of unknown function [Gryllus bimaculatus]|nr:Protein of unknown function [Gryllus bimaculatus]
MPALRKMPALVSYSKLEETISSSARAASAGYSASVSTVEVQQIITKSLSRHRRDIVVTLWI